MSLKLNLSLSQGFLTDTLVKDFTFHSDVSNNISVCKVLLKYLKASVDCNVDMMVVIEATGVSYQGIVHYPYTYCSLHDSIRSFKALCTEFGSMIKTGLDNKMLSMLGLERFIRLWYPPSEAYKLHK